MRKRDREKGHGRRGKGDERERKRGVRRGKEEENLYLFVENSPERKLVQVIQIMWSKKWR